jgi:uroporphyrinogen-III synthase
VGERKPQDLMPFINKHKKETFLFPCNDAHRHDLPDLMRGKKIKVEEAALYRTVDADLSDLEDITYDMICFFSPSGITSLFNNFPDFKQNDTRIAVFGRSTSEEAEQAGLRLDVVAPQPGLPSMTAAIEAYLKNIGQKAPDL